VQGMYSIDRPVLCARLCVDVSSYVCVLRFVDIGLCVFQFKLNLVSNVFVVVVISTIGRFELEG
jgi:hypothetical protein